MRPNPDAAHKAISPAPSRFDWRVYLALVSLAWLINYPGRLNPDTLDQLTQARNLDKLGDCQAPVLTWLYSLFAPVLGQPAGALLIQAMLMFVFPALVLSRTTDRRASIANMALTAAWGVLTAALVTITGQILKDVIEVGAILSLLAIIQLRSSPRNFSQPQFWCVLALLALVDTVRPTSFLMLAVAGSICALFAFGVRRKLLLSVSLIGVLSIGAFALPYYVNRHVLGAKNCGEEESLIIFDIAGISSSVGENLFAQLPGWTGDNLQRPWECYTPERWDSFKWGDDALPAGAGSSTRDCKQYAVEYEVAIHRPGAPSPIQWWFQNVLHHPLAYLEHRLAYTAMLFKDHRPLIGWGPYAINKPATIDQISGAVSHGRDLNGLTHGIDMTGKIQMWEPNILSVPFYWIGARLFARPASLGVGLLLCIGTLLWSWRTRRLNQAVDPVVIVSSALGVGNFIMFMAFGVADDGRYLVPTLICGIVSLLLTLRAEQGAALLKAVLRPWTKERDRLERMSPAAREKEEDDEWWSRQW
jgi:hypothetical protein